MTGFLSKRAMSQAKMQPKIDTSFQLLSKSIVDGEQWYTVSCLRDTSKWLRSTYREHEDKLWFQNIDSQWNINFNVFDVHEKIYIMLGLRWS